MTREEALNEIRSWAIPSEKGREVLETLIPELAASEDERARKWLYDFVHNCPNETFEFYGGVGKKAVLAYLEKQRYDRMQPVYDNQESFESALDKAWKSYNDSGARRVDGCEDNYTECAYAKGFREGYLFGLQKQKDLDKMIVVSPEVWDKAISDAYENGEKDGEKQKEKSMSATEVLARAGLKPYKDGNQWCILAGDNIQDGICGFGDTIDEALYQFLMEILEKQKEQKEESLRDFIDDFPYSDEQKEQKQEWKPKPESLEALMYAIEGKWDMISPTSYLSRRLEDLYEGLINTFNVDESLIAELPKVASRAYTAEGIEELRELKRKIETSMEQKPTECADDVVEEAEEYTSKVACGEYGVEVTEAYIAGVLSERNRGTEWSEEDKEHLKSIISTIEMCMKDCEDANAVLGYYDSDISWLKSLRPQSKKELSIEKAIQWLDDTFYFLNNSSGRGRDCEITTHDFDSLEEMYDSFRKAVTVDSEPSWKPREEQMKALCNAIAITGTCSSLDAVNTSLELESLREQLRKL